MMPSTTTVTLTYKRPVRDRRTDLYWQTETVYLLVDSDAPGTWAEKAAKEKAAHLATLPVVNEFSKVHRAYEIPLNMGPKSPFNVMAHRAYV